METEPMTRHTTADLNSTLLDWGCPTDVADAVRVLAAGGARLADAIADQRFPSNPQPDDGVAPEVLNGGNDVAHALDVHAHDLFVAALRGTSTRALVSEEAHEIVEIDPDGELLVAIDPLDGSSNIAINAPLGTIFGLRRHDTNGPDLETQFLEAGRHIVAAGYIMFGPTTVLVLSTGAGVAMFSLDRPTGNFLVSTADVRLPACGREFAINVSNYRHWEPHVCTYIDDLVSGADGCGGVDYNMRWVAALVAECHRVLTRGGVFLYPSDGRVGYRSGRLRLLYEAHPIGYLVEQAGGAALDGRIPVLDKHATTLHDRTPLIFGGAAEVKNYESYRDARPFTGETAPLFAARGLFRN